MPKEVIKRRGNRQAFKAEKMKRSIRMASKGGKVPAKKIKRVVSKVSAPVLRSVKGQKTVSTAVLRKRILPKLKKEEPVAWKAWMAYDKRRRARRKAAKKSSKKRK